MDSRRPETLRDIYVFLNRENWVQGDFVVEFLAAGEYNENYRVRTTTEECVFRINHGTQLGLENQIGYEFEVLRTVYASGVTPRPLHLCVSDPLFPRGAMLMEFLPGDSFSYARDSAAAARLFALIHGLPTSDFLVTQENPIADLVSESMGLLNRYIPHPLPDIGQAIREYAELVNKMAAEWDPILRDEPMCIVNTEVNSSNFIASANDSLKLCDWEKAVVSYRYQDLGHFLVPTTTLWKSEFRFTPELREEFLEEYHAAAAPAVSIDELDNRTAVLERTIVLRALSWCYMAYAEYTNTERSIRNDETFERISYYLENAMSFMGE